MCEKSLAGSSRKAAAAALAPEGTVRAPLAGVLAAAVPEIGVEVFVAVAVALVAGVVAAPGVVGRPTPKLAARPGFPPRRPPDRLSQPSTLSLKKSVRMMRLEVMPPCECPTSQKDLIFCLPTPSTTALTMFCKY